MVESCYVTGGLLDALLEISGDREPDSFSTLLAVSPAGDLEPDEATAATGDGAATGEDTGPAPDTATDEPTPGAATDGTTPDAASDGTTGGTQQRSTIAPGDLEPSVPVFTDLYLPADARSVDAVFGMDVSAPHGQAQGRFVSHPLGELSVSTTDDLHEVVLVAVPPWTRYDVAAFDRSGARLDLNVVAASPPELPFEQ